MGGMLSLNFDLVSQITFMGFTISVSGAIIRKNNVKKCIKVKIKIQHSDRPVLI
jgi:hypothetical protein